NKAIGAKINHKMESLYKVLESGDQVEIITSNNGRPKLEWLHKVFTAKAKQRIKSYLKKESDNNIQRGIDLFEEDLKGLGIKPSSSLFKKVLPAYKCTNKDEFYSKLGAGIIHIDNLKQVVKTSAASKIVKYWSLQFNNTFKLFGGGGSNSKPATVIQQPTNYQIAECCFPSPGDEVIGFKGKDDVVVVHKKSCPEAIRTASQNGGSIVATQWSSEKIMSYLSHVKINGKDRMGILLDLSLVVTKQLNVNIRKLHIESHDGIFEGYVSLYVKNNDDLKNIMSRISTIKGVETVHKIDLDEVNDSL
ncbi:MAG: ACT domain-containing protein, partial [Rikenellaceae bacterium]